MDKTKVGGGVLLAALCMIAGSGTGVAQQGTAASQVDIIVGFGSGGNYHTIGLLLSRHMNRYLPGNPNIIVRNMPGAGSLIAANHLAVQAPKDGSVLGIIGGGTILEPLIGNEKAQFDPRDLNWIGSLSQEANVCVVWHTVPVHNIEDAKKHEIAAGSTGRGSRTLTYPNALNELLGTQFKIVTGYEGGNAITLALERREIDSYCGWSWGSIKSRSMDWVRDGRIRSLLQFGYEPSPDLANIPMVLDVLENDRDRAAMELLLIDTYVAWPLVAPPGLPNAKIGELQKAYLATLDDPATLEEAKRLQLDVDPVAGADIQKRVAEIFSTSTDIVDHARKVAGMN